MRERYCVLVPVFLIVTVLAVGGFAQENPEDPEVPETPESEAVEQSEPELETEAEPEEPIEPDPTEEAAPEEPAGPLFETSIDFEFVKKTTLGGRAGEIDLEAVEFGSTSPKGGLFGTSDADLKSTITAQISCATTADKKQKIDFTLQFLDAEGNLIDRATEGTSLKAEAKVIEIKLVTLKYVIPLIKKVTFTAESQSK